MAQVRLLLAYNECMEVGPGYHTMIHLGAVGPNCVLLLLPEGGFGGSHVSSLSH